MPPSPVALLSLLACGEGLSLRPAPPPPAPVAAPFEDAPPASPRLPVDPEAVALATAAADRMAGWGAVAVTLDRPLYRPGETVWARVWSLATKELGGGAPKGEVYVELCDPRGSTIVAHRYDDRGAGTPADVTIPGDAAGGLYTLRVQVRGTTAERPLVVAAFEEPRIRKELDLLRDAYAPGDEVTASLVVASAGRGPLVDHPVQILLQVDGEALAPIPARTDADGEATLRFQLPAHVRGDAVLTVLVEEDGWSESVSKPIPVVLDRVVVEAFPEGGALVEGLPGRVYLRVRDAAGQPADASGVVEDAAGRAVARFETLHDGLARVDLTPEVGGRYGVRVTAPVSAAPVPLPVPLRAGCVLRTWDDVDGEVPELRAGVWCSTEQTVLVTGDLRGHAFAPASVRAGPSAPAVVELLPEDPAGARLQGVATVTVWSDEERPLAERLVYRNRSRGLQVSVEPTRTQYGPRDEVELRVTTRDPKGEPVSAELALSVVDDRLLEFADDEHGNLLSDLYLAPWIRGVPQDPGWYFDPDEPDAGRGLDLVLGTYGWRAFVTPNPDAGEGARARREEGTVGNREPRAGAPPWAGPPPGSAPNVVSGSHPLVGEPLALEIEAGGLGGRGVGLGGGGTLAPPPGGGTPEGLGGLGTKGLGSGSAGYRVDGSGLGAAQLGQPIVLGDVDPDNLHAVMRRSLDPLRSCYARVARRKPELAGQVVIKFTIARDGTVSEASTKRTTLHDASVESCIVGRFLRLQFAPPRGGGIAIVSYPIRFSQGDHPIAPAPPPPTPRRDPVRVFSQPDYRGQAAPAVRTDFRSTVGWWPDLRTGPDGSATVRVFLADPVTTWRVTAEGVGGGHAGRAEREVHSTLPFSLDVPLPAEVSFGDRLSLPIRLANRRSDPLDLELRTEVSAPLVADDGTGAQRVRLPAGGGAVTVVPIRVPDVIGAATVEVTARAGSLSDGVRRTLTVAPRGFPHRWTAGGTLGGPAEHRLTVEEALPGSGETKLSLFPSPVSALMDGAEAMVRMPHGCFEQTSSTNHPNVLLLEYLDRTGGSAGLAVDRTAALREGYRRLTGYQVPRGGFETFGSGPGKEVLSAYGLLQFTRMRKVFDEVDPTVTDRDVAFLLDARDGRGGYVTSGSSAHGYGAAPADVNDAFVTRALVETGHLATGPEVDRQRQQARSSTDPYVVALATLTLETLGDTDVFRAADRLASLQDADGAYPGARASVEQSGGRDLLTETTALATLALVRTGRHDDAVARGLAWLASARRGSAGWGNTQATVLALEAILAAADAKPPEAGSVRVVVDGEPRRTVAWTGRERGALVVDLGGLAPGPHRIGLVRAEGAAIPYTLEATWRRTTPADAPGAPLHLETTLAAEGVSLGHSVRLDVRVENVSSAAVASPIARVRLPAGVRVEEKALEALKDHGKVAFFETRPREVTLYWEGLAPTDRVEIPLDLVAEVPGVFTAPPSEVYPYYTSDAVDWEAGATLRIQP